MIGKELLHYKIVNKLGAGGMGAVYLAEDSRLERKVALKFLSPTIANNESSIKNFANEAKIAASLSHPNIAQVYAIEEFEGDTFIVFQYIEGEELQEYIQSHDLNEDEKIRIARSIAEGLLAAHEQGIIHRDIKAGNIMVSPKGRVKILDFGIAGLLEANDVMQTAEQLGTASYMAPELFVGLPSDIPSEIWAFGVVLYQLFSKKLPFDGHYQQAISYAILHEEPIPIKEQVPEISEVFASIITKCLEKDRVNRYQSISEILQELDEQETLANRKPISEESVFSVKQKTFIFSSIGILFIALIFSNLDLFSSVPETKRLAIIPFTNVGEITENAVFLDGILETMTSKLSQIDNYEEQLWVIPSSEILSNDISSITDAKNLFGINLAITGSLQDIAGSKRLTINLIDAENLRQLKSQVIDLSGGNMMGLQSESVSKMIQMLEIEMNDRISQTIIAGETNNANASAFYLSGNGYLYRYTQSDYLENAIRLFKQAIQEDSGFALAHASLGEAYWRKYQQTDLVTFVDSAQFYLDQAQKINNTLIEVKQVQALLYLGTGNYEEAIRVYSAVLETDSNNETALSGLAEAFDNVGDIEKAEIAYLSAIEIKPEYWLGHKSLGNFYIKNGEYQKAVAPLQKVVALTPDNHDGFSNLGVLFYYLSDWEQSIANFTRSLEIRPTESAASNLGTVHYILGNYEEASRYYEIAVDVNPNNYAVWGNLASLQGILGNSHQEIKFYRKAIEVAEGQLEVNPNDITLNTQLAAYYSDIGDVSIAISYIEKTLRLAPDVPEVSFRLASAYEKIGKRTEAVELMKTAIEQDYPVENILNQPELSDLVTDEEFQDFLKSIESD